MNWNLFYKNKNKCSEFNEIKFRIWNYNNYIPPLPKKPHPIAKRFKNCKSLDIKKCDICKDILKVELVKNQYYIANDIIIPVYYCTKYFDKLYRNKLFCNNCAEKNKLIKDICYKFY
jgi:hypothetical protein